MSWAATGFVKKLRQSVTGEPITKAEKLVLFVLADYHNEDRGDAWASLTHLAGESLHTRSGVVRTLRALETKGVIKIVRAPDATRRRVINRYQFVGLDCSINVPVDNPTTDGLQVHQASDHRSPGLVTTGHQTSDHRSPGLVTTGHQTSDHRSPGLVTTGHHIFPKNLSNDLSKGGGGAPPAPVCVPHGTQSRPAETPFPDPWRVEPWMLEFCRKRGCRYDDEFDKFSAHHKAKGSLLVSWPDAFRKWVLDSVRFRLRDLPAAQSRAPTMPVTPRRGTVGEEMPEDVRVLVGLAKRNMAMEGSG